MLTEKEINLIRREYPTPKILAKMILPKSDKEDIVTKEQKMGKFEKIHKRFIKEPVNEFYFFVGNKFWCGNFIQKYNFCRIL